MPHTKSYRYCNSDESGYNSPYPDPSDADSSSEDEYEDEFDENRPDFFVRMEEIWRFLCKARDNIRDPCIPKIENLEIMYKVTEEIVELYNLVTQLPRPQQQQSEIDQSTTVSNPSSNSNSDIDTDNEFASTSGNDKSSSSTSTFDTKNDSEDDYGDEDERLPDFNVVMAEMGRFLYKARDEMRVPGMSKEQKKEIRQRVRSVLKEVNIPQQEYNLSDNHKITPNYINFKQRDEEEEKEDSSCASSTDDEDEEEPSSACCNANHADVNELPSDIEDWDIDTLLGDYIKLVARSLGCRCSAHQPWGIYLSQQGPDLNIQEIVTNDEEDSSSSDDDYYDHENDEENPSNPSDFEDQDDNDGTSNSTYSEDEDDDHDDDSS
ncbi:hypothetical protein BDQ17DRAFT_1425524 [Cyathus striatus]|nr:hypothetical protein BDQ17DRAFT_1425524 [Cyathus striatus]